MLAAFLAFVDYFHILGAGCYCFRMDIAELRAHYPRKEVMLGTMEDADAYLRALRGLGMPAFDSRIAPVMHAPGFHIEKNEKRLTVVFLSPEALGFAPEEGMAGVTYPDACDAGKRIGLELCPAEVAPALRLQYRDQPGDPKNPLWCIYIAMEPIAYMDKEFIFGLKGPTREESFSFNMGPMITDEPLLYDGTVPSWPTRMAFVIPDQL